MTKLIFLDPVVLGAALIPFPTPGAPFNENACLAFQDLMNRVGDVAIILLVTYSPPLGKMKEMWEHYGLSGNKIIQVIGDRGVAFCSSHSVHEWLRHTRKGPDSFVIIDRMPREDSYPERLVVVKNLLSSQNVETILGVLEQPFSESDIKREYLSPERSGGDECVCC